MDEKSKKTKRSEEDIVSSGVTPGGTTLKDEKPVIRAGIVVAPTPTTQVISAGIVSAVGGEIVLNNKNYKVLKVIAQSTGEAEVYLLEREKQKYIFKYYYPAFKPKDAILQQLKGLTHEDIVDLIDYGYYQGRFFEILEYAEGGTLMDTNPDGTYRYIPIKDMKRIKQIVKEIVNALEFCHSKGIIHRDIKPENIFFTNPDGTDIQIGDFGISSVLDEGLSKHLTGQARTAIYAAPELYQSIGGKTVISKEVDYYALGITLIHIFSGEQPFKDLAEFAIMKIKCDGKVNIPDDAPEELRNLIKGLITVEPSKRWGYNEVQKWLKGEYVPVYYETIEFKYKPFPFDKIKGEDIIARNPQEMAELLLNYPETGKKHLYKGRVQRWLEDAGDPVYVAIEKITEKEYPADEDAGLIKSAYMIDPLKNYKTFAGIECRNAEEIGDAIEQESSYYKVYLKNKKNADLYLYLEARGYEDIANAFRKYAQAFNQERAFNTIVLELQGKEKFKFGNLIFFKPEDLLATEGEVKDKLIKELTNPDSKLSIWLEQFTELKNSIERWRKIGRYDATTLSYALDRESSFIINGEKARDVKEFESLLSKHILDIQKDIVPDSIFVKEADYWLHNYYNFKFATCLINTIGSNITKEFASDDMRKVYEWLCEVWIEYARAQFNRILRNEFVKLLKKINQNHQYLKFHAKEEQLIEELIKIEQTKLENTRKKELEKIEGDKKKELELLRNNYKQIQMQKFWEGEGKKIIFVGLSMTVAWTLFFAVKGGGVLIWIGAIIGGIAGLIYGGLFGAIIGLVVGGVVGVILPFVITPVFLYLLIRTLLSYHHINREASEILLPAATQKNYQDRIDKVQSEIEDKRKNIEQQIVNKVFKMDSIEINKELQSLTTTTNSKQV